MPDKHYDIFISYRREGGKNYARVIKPELEKRGFRVFLDFDELKDGKFDQRILDAIDDAPIFMLILSKGCLDRCVNDDDWVRQEILHADRKGKHMVPVEVDKSFRSMPDLVPDDVRNIVGQHQFSQVDSETLLQASMDELVHYRIRPYITGAESTSDGAEIHVETDADCAILRYQKEIGLARAGEDTVIRLKKGRHKLEFVSREFDSVRQSSIVEVPDDDYSYYVEVQLLDAVEAMRRAEQEKREAEERRIREAEERRRREEEEKRKAEKERRRKAEEQERRLRAEERERQREAEEQERRLRVKERERQQEEAEEKRRQQERSQDMVFKVGNVSFKMVYVDGGSFTMGMTASPESEVESWERDFYMPHSFASVSSRGERPPHGVMLGGYYIGQVPVTQALWAAVMGKKPSRFKGLNLIEALKELKTKKLVPFMEDNRPVVLVSWHDCQKFVKRLSQMLGHTFRLPTEAEWEYAALGGGWANGYRRRYAGSNDVNEVAWWRRTSTRTHPVARLKANQQGLYDMCGNVSEWCSDWYGEYSANNQTNPVGCASGQWRVLRGGDWSCDAWHCRVTHRSGYDPSIFNLMTGLRLAMTL